MGGPDIDETIAQHRQEQLLSEYDAETTCAYCLVDRIPLADTAAPAADDDAAWERLALHHDPRCEWITTRAHRMDG